MVLRPFVGRRQRYHLQGDGVLLVVRLLDVCARGYVLRNLITVSY